jgi:PST family polysaccharide transporter
VYGSQWLPAAKALPWLMALGLVRIGCELAYDCLVATGQRRNLILVQGLWLVALLPVLIAGARVHGIVGVAQGHVLVAVGLVVPVFLYALGRAGIGLAPIARACAWPLFGGAVMALVILAAKQLLGEGTLALLAVGMLALATYVVCVLPSRRHLLGSRTAETV